MTLLALADQPVQPAVGPAIVAALSEPQNTEDRWIPDAATCAAAKNSENFLSAVASPLTLPSPPSEGGEGRVRGQPSAKLLSVTSVVAEHYARGGPTDSVATVVAGLSNADPQIAAAVMRGLTRGWPAGNSPKLEDRLERNLEQVLHRLTPEQRGVLVKLAVAWGSKKFEKYAAEAAQSLLAQVKNEMLKTEERLAAARELIGYRSTDRQAVQALLDVITPAMPPELAKGLLDALRPVKCRRPAS